MCPECEASFELSDGAFPKHTFLGKRCGRQKVIKVYHAQCPDWASLDPQVPKAFPAGFNLVAEVDGDLEQAFEKTNHIDQAWQKNLGVKVRLPSGEHARSTSVGDVFVDDSGTRHLICGVGFKTF